MISYEIFGYVTKKNWFFWWNNFAKERKTKQIPNHKIVRFFLWKTKRRIISMRMEMDGGILWKNSVRFTWYRWASVLNRILFFSLELAFAFLFFRRSVYQIDSSFFVYLWQMNVCWWTASAYTDSNWNFEHFIHFEFSTRNYDVLNKASNQPTLNINNKA